MSNNRLYRVDYWRHDLGHQTTYITIPPVDEEYPGTYVRENGLVPGDAAIVRIVDKRVWEDNYVETF
jgi:hypothetical protein